MANIANEAQTIGRLQTAQKNLGANYRPTVQPQSAPVARLNITGRPTNRWMRLAQVGAAKVTHFKLLQQAASLGKQAGEDLVSAPVGLAKDVNSGVVQPIVESARPLIKNPGQIIPSIIKGGTPDVRSAHDQFQQNLKFGKITPQIAKFTGQAGNINPRQYESDVNKLVAQGKNQKDIANYLQDKINKTNTSAKRVGGEALGTAALIYGGPEAKGLLKGAKEVASSANKIEAVLKGLKSLPKKTAPIGGAGAAGNVGSTLQAKPNASGKELAKSAATGYAGGVALGTAGKVSGSAVRKGVDMVFGKTASKALAKNVVTNQLLKKGEELNKPKSIPVSDQSSGAVQGTVSKTLPKSRVSIPVKGARPSDLGYTDTQFRLQFNKGAKQVVKSNTDIGAAYIKTGSKDPLTLTVHALANATSKNKIVTSVRHLLPTISSDLKNQTVRDIQKAKDPQEVAHLLWDAAKTHEARINAPGTPMAKKISFSSSTIKSELSSDLKDMVARGKVEPTIKTAKTSDLKLGSDTVSDGLDRKTVEQYKADIKTGKPIPPLVVSKDTKGNMFVQDGAHKLQAAKELGVTDVPVVHQVSKESATTKPVSTASLKPVKVSGKTAPSQLSAKILQKSVEDKLTEDLGDVKEHTVLNMQDQAKKAVDLLAKDEQRATDIALGKRSAPSGLHPHAVLTAVENKARHDGNSELIRELAHSKSMDMGTAAGQTLRVLRERDSTSPVAQIQHILDARKAAAEKRLGEPVTRTITKTMKEIDSHIKAPTKSEWSSFVESLKC